jgi:hypothetical protein
MHNGMGRTQITGLVVIATSFGFLLQLVFFMDTPFDTSLALSFLINLFNLDWMEPDREKY